MSPDIVQPPPFAATVLTMFPDAFPGPLGVSLIGSALAGSGTVGAGGGGHPRLFQG